MTRTTRQIRLGLTGSSTMQTASDVDLELIFSLGEELEKKCESSYHASGKWGHADGTSLWYVRKILPNDDTPCCNCGPVIRIFCDGFITDSEYEQGDYTYFTCSDCWGMWRIQRLEPVK
jgi:hypothetical protein